MSITDKEIRELVEDRDFIVDYSKHLEFQLQQEKNLNRDHEKDYLEVWKLIKRPKENVAEAVKRLLKERDDLLKCLENERQ